MEPTQFITANVYSLRPGYRASGMVCLAFMSALASGALQAAPNLKAQAQSNYGKLPLSFEANQGQADAQVKFLAHGQGYVLFLTPTEAVLSLKKSQTRTRNSSFTKFSPSSPPNTKFSPSTPPNRKFSPSSPPNAKFSPSTPPNRKFSPSSFMSSSSQPKEIGTVLRMQFIGANPAPQLLGEEALTGQVNYLIGNDPGRWLTGVPTYAKVAYEGVYSGVNLVYYGNQGQLEYDFVVAPGADPRQIKLAFRGANKIEINPAGELVLHTASGELRVHKPVIYQEIGGARKSIKGGFVLKDGQTVGFQVAAYDAAHPLIIDPVLVYSTYLGGSGFDRGLGIAVDVRGQAYVTGATSSTDFPARNATQPVQADLDDAFVAQLAADGASLRYATYLGGSENDLGTSIAVDLRGQASVTGQTASSDFPTVDALQPIFGGGADVFVAQLTADGTALRYATYLGGSGFDTGGGIALDLQGLAYVTGGTQSPDFPTENALQPRYGGGSFDAFVAQLAADGSALRYATYLGGRGFDAGNSIAVTPFGQAYVTGGTDSSDFPTESALQPSLDGINDAFVAKLSADGAALDYSTYLGGSDSDAGLGIAVDLRGQAYVAGNTGSIDFPTENALQPDLNGIFDAFVTKLSADGATLSYSTYLGGGGDDEGLGIAVDLRGQAYVTGRTISSDFPTVNALQSTLGGPMDGFVAQIRTDGRAFRYSTYLGGSGFDNGSAIAVDLRGQAYVTGNTGSTDFPARNALQPTLGGLGDAFVTKIREDNLP
jgi:hypothetical protein